MFGDPQIELNAIPQPSSDFGDCPQMGQLTCFRILLKPHMEQVGYVECATAEVWGWAEDIRPDVAQQWKNCATRDALIAFANGENYAFSPDYVRDAFVAVQTDDSEGLLSEAADEQERGNYQQTYEENPLGS